MRVRRRLVPFLAGALLAAGLAAWFAPQLALFALTAWLRAQTGREVTAEGAAIRWGGETTFELSGLRLANARWGSEPWMLSVDHLRLRAPVMELLRGGLLSVVEVRGATLWLEVRGNEGNWEFADRPAPFVAFGGGVPHIASLQLRDLRIAYHDPARERDLLGAIAGASGSLGVPGWRIRGQGTLDFKSLSFQLQSRGEVLEVALTLGDTTLFARGSPATGRYAVHAEGADLRHAFPVIPIPFPSTPAYRFDAQLVHEGTRARLHGLRGVLGQSDLAGELEVRLAVTPRVTGSLRSRTLHLADLKGFIGVPVRGPPPRPGRVLPDTPINDRRFFRLALALDYRADQVAGAPLPVAALTTHVALGEGVLRLEPFRFALAGGPAGGRAQLDVRGGPPRASLQLELRDARLGRLVSRLPLLDASHGRVRGGLRLRGAGESLAGIFASSRGEVALLMSDGALDRRFVDALSGDLLRLLFPEPRGATARLTCAVAVFDVEGGVARADAVVAETPDARVSGKGRVDLRRERLDLTLAAQPRETSVLVAPTPVTLTGTLAEPRLEADASALAGRAAAAVTLGALLGPLGALAPFTAEGKEADGECDDLLARIKAG